MPIIFLIQNLKKIKLKKINLIPQQSSNLSVTVIPALVQGYYKNPVIDRITIKIKHFLSLRLKKKQKKQPD